MVFITLKLIVFFLNSATFLTFLLKFVLFCLIVTKLYYELLNNHFFPVNYKLFCLFSVLSDAILTLLLNLFFKTDINYLM